MPLVMGGVETERANLVIFDTEDPTQIHEASVKVGELIGKGFSIDELRSRPGEVRLIPPKKKSSMGFMRVLTKNGDDRIVWDRDFPDQIKDAYKMFKDLLAKGYTAYIAMTNGEKGHSIDEFDPLAEEIIMVPGTMPG